VPQPTAPSPGRSTPPFPTPPARKNLLPSRLERTLAHLYENTPLHPQQNQHLRKNGVGVAAVPRSPWERHVCRAEALAKRARQRLREAGLQRRSLIVGGPLSSVLVPSRSPFASLQNSLSCVFPIARTTLKVRGLGFACVPQARTYKPQTEKSSFSARKHKEH